jgi:hypothetical protein
MGLWERFRARRAIKAYARRLPRLLHKDYGGSDAYTPAQVQRTIERYGLDRRHYSYAFAMFCNRENFDEFRTQFSPSVGYDEIREEIAFQYFVGASFAMSDFTSDPFGADGTGHAGDFGPAAGSPGDSGSN